MSQYFAQARLILVFTELITIIIGGIKQLQHKDLSVSQWRLWRVVSSGISHATAQAVTASVV